MFGPPGLEGARVEQPIGGDASSHPRIQAKSLQPPRGCSPLVEGTLSALAARVHIGQQAMDRVCEGSGLTSLHRATVDCVENPRRQQESRIRCHGVADSLNTFGVDGVNGRTQRDPMGPDGTR